MKVAVGLARAARYIEIHQINMKLASEFGCTGAGRMRLSRGTCRQDRHHRHPCPT